MTDQGPPRGVTRREWLKWTIAGSAAGVATAPSSKAQAFSLLRTPEALPAESRVASYCELCFWNCGLVAHVRKNRVLHLEGHAGYPTARGKLCGRGMAGAAFLRDADRLRYPMVRVGRRGEGKFERVGWKVAYETIARGFGHIREKHGPEALALFYHGTGGPLLRTMMVAYGSPNYAGPSYAQCKGPREVGYKLTFGEKLGSPEPLDFENTHAMVLFGSHLGENAHNSQVQEFARARARGAKLIVLDPRLSTVASKADVWLPLRPGSDTAVILAWIHLLIAENQYDKEFVGRHCIGFERLARHVEGLTPQWAAERAGISASLIRDAYALMRAARPRVLVHPGRHVTWYGEADTQRARGQAILTALLGAWWSPGGIYRPAPAPALVDFPTPDFPEARPHVDHAAERFPFAQEVTTNGIRDATITGRPYPIKGWFVHGTNLMQSLPNKAETIEAIQQLDMLAVCDVQPTEITRYADVLLPEDLYLERYDDFKVGGGLEPYVGIRQPVVTSPYDTRPAWRIAKELGEKLGVGDFFAFAGIEEYLEKRLEGLGVSLAELKEKGIHFPGVSHHPYHDPREELQWRTPSGKVELYSAQLEEKGFSPLPIFVEPPGEAGKATLRLLYGRSPLHSFGRTQNNPVLADLEGSNFLWIHPQAASARGIGDGDGTIVENASGKSSGLLRAKVTERMDPASVYMVHGFGHRAPDLSRADGRGGSDSDLIEHYVVDPISGATGMRTEVVTVRRARPGDA